MKTFIGIDNGVSGTIGIINDNETVFLEVPTFTQQNYTKKRANISRIDFNAMIGILSKYKADDCLVLIERPMVNPSRFRATTSALRALESILIAIESLTLPHMYIDSKEWQKVLLPKGVKGSAELKRVSMDIGGRLFPQYLELIRKHKDADGLLIAEYGRRKYK